MFYQIFHSPQVKRCAIITNKHGIYQLLHEMASYLRLRILRESQAKARHFSHVTKSRIFKNLNLREKADRNFRHTFLKNRFSHLTLCSIPQDWLEVVVIWAPFERRKIEVHIFERANISGFGMWNVIAKENLNR